VTGYLLNLSVYFQAQSGQRHSFKKDKSSLNALSFSLILSNNINSSLLNFTTTLPTYANKKGFYAQNLLLLAYFKVYAKLCYLWMPYPR